MYGARGMNSNDEYFGVISVNIVASNKESFTQNAMHP